MRDSSGRLVADPLRKGRAFCVFHIVPFCIVPARASESIIAYIDLETNSLDVLSDRIVEVGALLHGSYDMFSTVVHPGRDACPDAAAVHGIPHDELLSAPHRVYKSFGVIQTLSELFLNVGLSEVRRGGPEVVPKWSRGCLKPHLA